MKNIDLNTVKDLTTIKDNILKIFDKRINEAKINDFVNSIDNLSFIYCKQLLLLNNSYNWYDCFGRRRKLYDVGRKN